ncbi:NAD(P)(+) transhydrogenase (Re/Si-specific) subunit beta [Porphyromonas uenonis]|uniref:NAD(P)(+) transhydrogenase (Re/Si-specific) subunit beta n=4 Tax=Porphyromonas TaxID=836 RepID=UPI0026EA42AA|nr:NAD(P)(+) transhydrogenase (Re/Si-specific) subunit beta [Porphyromonas uenonis]
MNTLIEISNPVYYVICGILSILVLAGIAMMSKVKSATRGNALSATAMGLGVIVTLLKLQVVTFPWLIAGILIGGIIGVILYTRVKMIQMPQMVALLNGIGGGASALVGALTLFQLEDNVHFTLVTAFLAIIIGMLTLVGSLVAAGKLHRVLPQKSVVWPFHNVATSLTLVVAVFFLLIGTINYQMPTALLYAMIGTMLFSALFGLYFSIRVGGADMPITISLLNSLSGVAGAIAGMAIGDIFLVAVGGVVGASGLLLTQIMCRAMNRSLINILIPHGKAKAPAKPATATTKAPAAPQPKQESSPIDQAVAMLRGAKRVIIVPGYGMALAQAQQEVKQLADKLARNGAEVKYAIHPVAGRMPGHMNVLLAEANVDYDSLYEMEAINDQFANTDAVIVIGANDVLNPAARNAEGTPIYGMPVLNVDQAKQVIICNYDLKPGYAGVENPLYSRGEGVALCLGDAKATIDQILSGLDSSAATAQPASSSSASDPISQAAGMLRGAKRVIIVPGYGMALAQAQQEVKQLADKLAKSGAEVKYAIHPVAGRMPGHMNVLLAEANVDYDSLYEMEAINDQFANADAVIVIGANDVLNPAARNAEGTPIYGMPVLNVDQAKQVIICNFDLKPGYAGVENPLYSRGEGVALCLGDAKATIDQILSGLDSSAATAQPASSSSASDPISQAASMLRGAKRVIIVPGYGMALAQAQQEVKQLADKLARNGAEVKYAIHPVAGRMPGHMNVLLAEANVDYDSLYEMEAINDQFANTDAVIVIGANDVLNPAARNAEGTPIYGMPVLNVDQAKQVIICNFDLKPGYAGVENPLYSRGEGVALCLGDAKATLSNLMDRLDHAESAPAAPAASSATSTATPLQSATDVLHNAKRVIIVPGYGMALAQAQQEVKQLADKLARNGAEVKYAIHPVAGRMPGHMNVLLAEANVDYDSLYEMEAINDQFANTDAVIVIGANDVLNPAARNAEGTPIYGMPVLNVDQAKQVIICNFDLKPGYAGVENPLYSRGEGVTLLIGDAKKTLSDLIDTL